MADEQSEGTQSMNAEEPLLAVVAIGASAGGLEAMRALFGAVLPDPRIAYVVITHLPATHVSHLPELLGKSGPLPAVLVGHGDAIQGGRIHVLPHDVPVGISGGVITLGAAPESETIHRPIDRFMNALADDLAEAVVGVVLSGTDHDGTAGLKAIRAAGGLALVQDPVTAQFPGMPNSAIAAGAADQVLAPAEVPAAVSSYLDHVPGDLPAIGDTISSASTSGVAGEADGLSHVLALVLARTGHDFRWYRPGMLRRRLRRRMGLRHFDRVADYLAFIETSPEEVQALKSEFLIGVTDFFRDPNAWEVLRSEVLPALLAGRQDDVPIRIWTPGCATGEESYSVAMLVIEHCEMSGRRASVQVFGTDIDTDALAFARVGSYPESIAGNISVERLARFFERRGNRFVVRKSLRDCVLFAPQNLVRDIPFSRLDLVLCRNLLIYFEPSLQERVLDLLHFAIRPGGYLLLGKAESAGPSRELFEPASKAVRLYRRVGARSHLPGGFVPNGISFHEPRPAIAESGGAGVSHHDILQAHVSRQASTAAILVDRGGRPLHFHGSTGLVLEPQGAASLDLAVLVRPELRVGIRQVLRDAEGERRACIQTAAMTSGGLHRVEICAEPVDPGQGVGLTVLQFTFDPARLDGDRSASSPPEASAWGAVEREIEDGRRQLALALQEAERTNEDLRIASEESLALNEELQSANEELESSKEELESLNEELATVNSELEEKLSEIARNRDDLANLLSSTHIATVLLDRDGRIRRFTPAACTLFSLRPGDEGRLLTDISNQLDDPNFLAVVAGVLESGKPHEGEVKSRDGTSYLRRILPFVTNEARVDGVVATFVDITPLRAAAQQTRRLLSVLQDSNDAVISFDADGRILSWNASAERTYGYAADEAARIGLAGLAPTHRGTAAMALLEEVRRNGRAGPCDVQRVHKDGRLITVSVTAVTLRDEQGQAYAVLSTERDLTEQLQRETEFHFQRLADDIPALLRVEDKAGHATFVNRAWLEFTGEERECLLGEGWLRYVHPEDRGMYLENCAKAVAERVSFDLDFRMLRKDGIYRWMRLASVPHVGADGAYDGYVALTLDVERRKSAELALLETDRRKDQFLALLAHELRNPLAPVRNAVALLSMLDQADPRAAWATEIIGRQTNVMARLLDDLLDVARIGRGKVTLAMGPVDVSVLIDRALEVGRPLIDAGHHQLTVVQTSERMVVEGDIVRLTQVLANLLNNAAKYTPDGGTIHVESSREGKEAIIGVTDNGTGMTPEVVQRAFELFAQADRTLDRSQGGLGLGLSLARQLAALHGGGVDASSEGLGKGSRFVLRLPLAHVLDVEALSPRVESQVTTVGRRILVVDDNHDAALTLAMVLRLSGHEVWVAADGDEAIAAAQRHTPDVVVLDIGLPKKDGYEVARILRGQAATARTLLIAMTGYGQAEDRERASSSGFDHHFVKPVDPAMLSDLLVHAKQGNDGPPGTSG